MRFQNTKRFADITTFKSRFSVIKKVSVVITLFRKVGIGLFCKREPSFALQPTRVHYISLQFNSVVCNYGLFQLILNVINRFGLWCVDFVKFHAGGYLVQPYLQPRVLVALIQCATMATEVVEVATEREEDVIINCVVLFYEEGKEGENFRRVVRFNNRLLHWTWTLYDTRRSQFQKKHLFRVPQLAQGRPK